MIYLPHFQYHQPTYLVDSLMEIITYFLYLTDSFDMGFDIQHYYSLHQNLTLEDLAKASSRHTLKGLVKVINKVSLSPTDIFLVTLNFPKDFSFKKLMHFQTLMLCRSISPKLFWTHLRSFGPFRIVLERSKIGFQFGPVPKMYFHH